MTASTIRRHISRNDPVLSLLARYFHTGELNGRPALIGPDGASGIVFTADGTIEFVGDYDVSSYAVTATGTTASRTQADRANDRGFAILDDGATVNGSTSDTTALTAQLARRPGSTFAVANAVATEKPLVYGPGRHLLTGQTITTTGTGQRIVGAGPFITRLMGAGIVIDDYRCSVADLSLTDAGDFGLKFTHPSPPNSARSISLVDNFHIRDRTIGILAENGSYDHLTNFHIEGCDWGVVETLDGSLVDFKMSNGRIGSSSVNGFYAPDGQVKLSNIEISASGSTGILVRERSAGAAAVECYYTHVTSTSQAKGAFFTISGCSNIGGGLVRFTVSAAFKNRVGDYVTIRGTTDYNATYTIVAIASDWLTFDVTATFTSSQTGEVQRKLDNVWHITGVTDAGGGNVQITTESAHKLRAGLTELTITGTTSYNGVKTVVAVTGPTTFTVAATYVSSQTGTCSLPNWDIAFDGVGDVNRVNDHFAVGGNFNYVFIGSAYAISFIGTRLKQVIWKESADAARIFIVRNRRGRDTGSENLLDVPVIGPGSYRGWGEISYSDDSNETDGGMIAIAVPHEAAGVGLDNKPTLNEFRVKEDGHEATVNGARVWLLDDTNGITLVPKASTTPTNNGELTVQATSNTSLTFKLKGSDGTVRSGSITLS